MSWFKVDDALWRSLKLTRVSLAATGLWVRAGSWCRDSKTGGYVPRGALPQIAPGVAEHELDALAQELVDAKVEGIHEHGLWNPMANGWLFHDWEQFQPDDEISEQRRENIRQVRSAAGALGALARWQKNGKQSFANGNDGNPGIPRTPARRDPPSGSDPVSVETISGQDDLSVSDQDSSDPSLPKDLTGSARVSADSNTGPFRSEDERAVFEHWAAKLWPLVHQSGRKPRATKARLKHIRARLRDGYSVDDLRAVVDVVAGSRWHLGDNESGKPYIEIENIMRNETQVDRHLARPAVSNRQKPFDPLERAERLRAEGR